MKLPKEFEYYIKKGVIRKLTPDKPRAEFLIKESKVSLEGLRERIEIIGINDKNANSIIKDCYDIIMEIIRAKLLLVGYSSSGRYAHEGEISYLKKLGFSEGEISFLNELRYFRNSVTYYGKILDREYAEKVVDYLEKSILKLKKFFNEKESLPITRSQALELLEKYNPRENKHDWNHYLESEAIMKGVALKLGEDEEYWAMLGLLHDVDWGITKENVSEHLTKAPAILREAGFDEEFINNIVSHGCGFECAGLKDKKRSQKVEHALAACETLTGLIHAYALMRGGRISDMEIKGLKKKFKDKKFAEGCNREIIKEIEECGLLVDEFFEVGINAMKSIKNDVGLK